MSNNGRQRKPFSPRSLVGMTMGARKRAARCAAVKHPMRKRVKLVWFKCWSRDYHRRCATLEDAISQAHYEDSRARYRIGERLRQCPWCKLVTSLTGQCPGRGWNRDLLPDLSPPCDGSGVQPARVREAAP